MQPFSGDMLQVLATFSAVGFAISFGIPALLSYRWSVLRKATARDRLVEFDIRFIGMFSDPKVTGFSLFLGVFSLLSGVLILIYQVTGITIVVELVVWIELFVMIGVIALMVGAWAAAWRVSRKQILKVLEYWEDDRVRKAEKGSAKTS